MVELRGLEPLTSTLPVLRTSQLYYSPEHEGYFTTEGCARQGGNANFFGKTVRPAGTAPFSLSLEPLCAAARPHARAVQRLLDGAQQLAGGVAPVLPIHDAEQTLFAHKGEIGRASCRERV